MKKSLLISHLTVFPLAYFSKIFSYLSRFLNLGNGSTWPGHLALLFNKSLFEYFLPLIGKRIIIVAGTNGKTTTAKMVTDILQNAGYAVVHNQSGANLLNGVASTLLLSYSVFKIRLADYAVFEVDEATVPLILKVFGNRNLTVVFLNLFRDQLDRYGEVDHVARIWLEVVSRLETDSIVILNADDPQVAEIGKKTKSKKLYFGIDDKSKFLPDAKEHATDSTYCLNCGFPLTYTGMFYSHLGHWECLHCGESRPEINLSKVVSVLPGLYNYYNTLASVLTARSLGVSETTIEKTLKNFRPAFGRQEEFVIDDKTVKVFLAKNPVSMNESLKTVLSIKDQEAKNAKVVAILALNDNIPDGRDVSWIWDVDFENLITPARKIICSGQRADDLAVRIKYAALAQKKEDFFNLIEVRRDLTEAVKFGLQEVSRGETLYVLPTYSAMLEVRKIVGGKKIL